MLIKIVTTVLLIAQSLAEPPVEHYSSAEAVSSQSFVRHDVPLSYKMSSVHPKYEIYHPAAHNYRSTESPSHVAQSPSFEEENHKSTSPKYHIEYITQNPNYMQDFEAQYVSPSPTAHNFAPQTFGTQSPQAQQSQKPFHYMSKSSPQTQVAPQKSKLSQIQQLNTHVQSAKHAFSQSQSHLLPKSQTFVPNIHTPSEPEHTAQNFASHEHTTSNEIVHYQPSHYPSDPQLHYSNDQHQPRPNDIQQSSLQYYPSQDHFSKSISRPYATEVPPHNQFQRFQYIAMPFIQKPTAPPKPEMHQLNQFIYPQQLVYQKVEDISHPNGALYMIVGVDGAVKRLEYQPNSNTSPLQQTYKNIQTTEHHHTSQNLSPEKYMITSVKSSPLMYSQVTSSSQTASKNTHSFPQQQSSLTSHSKPVQYYLSNSAPALPIHPKPQIEYSKASASESLPIYYNRQQKLPQDITHLYPVKRSN